MKTPKLFIKPEESKSKPQPPTPELSSTHHKSSKPLRIISSILIIVLAIITFRFVFWPTTSTDPFRVIGYEMPADVSALSSRLGLTDFAKFTFTAVHPVLEGREEFNEHCHSHDAEISILGCYTSDNHIYLYNIQSDELKGIIESTAAHELLHAAWDRLPFWEQDAISREIMSFYDSNKDSLSADLDIYHDDQLIDELHSRIGTEFADLPDTLEAYYARYFTDQDAIVAYYNNYSAKFLELKAQIDEIDALLDEQEAEIDSLQASYNEREAAFNDSVDRFNSCAETPDCFTDAEFAIQRAALLDERAALEELLSELNAKIDTHNLLVDEYNSNVLRSRTLEDTINSNSTPIENP